jgi:hypothetical protein
VVEIIRVCRPGPMARGTYVPGDACQARRKPPGGTGDRGDGGAGGSSGDRGRKRIVMV